MLQGKQRTIYAYICISIVLCFGVVFILNKAQKNWNWGLSNLSDNTISKMERYINNNPNDLEAMHELVLQYIF